MQCPLTRNVWNAWKENETDSISAFQINCYLTNVFSTIPEQVALSRTGIVHTQLGEYIFLKVLPKSDMDNYIHQFWQLTIPLHYLKRLYRPHITHTINFMVKNTTVTSCSTILKPFRALWTGNICPCLVPYTLHSHTFKIQTWRQLHKFSVVWKKIIYSGRSLLCVYQTVWAYSLEDSKSSKILFSFSSKDKLFQSVFLIHLSLRRWKS